MLPRRPLEVIAAYAGIQPWGLIWTTAFAAVMSVAASPMPSSSFPRERIRLSILTQRKLDRLPRELYGMYLGPARQPDFHFSREGPNHFGVFL